MVTARKDALKAAAVVGMASLVSGEANIRENADNFGRERNLNYYQPEESWYDIPDPMQNQHQPVHYQQQPVHNNEGAVWWYGGDVMPEAKAVKEDHGNGGGYSGWWQPGGYSGKTSKTDYEAEPYGWPQQNSGSAKTSKTHQEAETPSWWQPGSGKVEKMHPEVEVEAPSWWQPGSGKVEKMHPEVEVEAPSWWQPGSGKVEKMHQEPVPEMTHPTKVSEWWDGGSGKSAKGKSDKAKSAKKTSSGGDSSGGDWWWGSMPATTTAATTTEATMPIETTTHIVTMPAAKGDKGDDDDVIGTTSTWWAVPDGAKSHKSGKSAKAGKTDKSGKSTKTGEVGWDSTWTPPTPCAKAGDCEHPAPPSGGHTEVVVPPPEEVVSPPTTSPVAPLIPVTMAPVAGETRGVPATSSPTTIIDALTSEAGWFQSGKNYETEELAYKRERVEGLAKQMEWKNASSRPQAYTYFVVGAAAGLFFMLCLMN
eukprot:scaffold5622_cov106-Skeletonema_dohrnii-CCMP3373.AAC.2